MHLATDDKLFLSSRVVLCGVVRVHLAPIFHRGAIIRVGGCNGCLGVCLVGIEPLPVAAVEVPVIVGAKESFMAFGNDGVEGGLTLPGLDDGVAGQGEVPGQESFFPDNRGHVKRADDAVSVVDKGLEKRLDDGGGIRADGWVESVDLSVDFVAAGVEERREWADAGEKVS